MPNVEAFEPKNNLDNNHIVIMMVTSKPFDEAGVVCVKLAHVTRQTCVCVSGPVKPGHPSAVRVRLYTPYPHIVEQLLHALQSLNPLDPHCCV